MLRFAAITGFLFCSAAVWAQSAGQVEYVGGTVPGVKQATQGNLRTVDADYLAFLSRKFTLKVLYERVNLLEYGQELDTQRNYALALVSPILFLSKKRTHFLTVGYADDEGRQQAIVFRVAPRNIRPLLASLEARTGQKVQLQDNEARKTGRR